MLWEVAGCGVGRSGRGQDTGARPAAPGQPWVGWVSPRVGALSRDGRGERPSYGPRSRRSWERWERDREEETVCKSPRALVGAREQ